MKQFPNKLVPGIESKEWRSYVKAGQKFWKSKLFCIKAREAYEKAWTETYNKVWQSYLTAKEAEDKAEELYYDLTEETYRGESAYIKAGRSFAKAIETYIMAMKAFDKIGKAREAYEKAWEALEKANIAYYKARDAYYSKYANELQILHDEMFPDCTWDGKTIF